MKGEINFGSEKALEGKIILKSRQSFCWNNSQWRKVREQRKTEKTPQIQSIWESGNEPYVVHMALMIKGLTRIIIEW